MTHVTPNNLAYTGAKLGLHTDLPYCEYPPGVSDSVILNVLTSFLFLRHNGTPTQLWCNTKRSTYTYISSLTTTIFYPQTTWLHCIKQHVGKGGENDLSDGFNAAKILKERQPHHFDTLVNTPIYFQDQGYAHYDFDKITQKNTVR